MKGKNGKSVSTKPLPKKKIFPFDKLPAEIKNQIYDLTLKDENGIYLILKIKAYRRTIIRSTQAMNDLAGDARRHRRHVPRNSQAVDAEAKIHPPAALVPNLLLLNRETYAQTQPILYGSNNFAVEDTTALHAFLAMIGKWLSHEFNVSAIPENCTQRHMNHLDSGLPSFEQLSHGVTRSVDTDGTVHS